MTKDTATQFLKEPLLRPEPIPGISSSAQTALYAAIVENSPDAIVVKTLEGTVVSWNRGAERLYGYSAEEIIGKPCSIICPPDRRPELLEIFEAVKRGEIVDNWETIRQTKDGKRIDILMSWSPIFDQSGQIVALCALGHDITKRKQMERELRLLNENLENRVQIRTQEMERRAVQLRALATQLIEVEQQERRRFSQLLHDHLQQILVGAKMLLAKIRNNPKNVAAEITEVMGILDEAIKESKSLTVQLSPPLSLSHGLKPTLEWLADWAHRQHQLHVEVIMTGDDRPCTEEIGYFIFNAVKECLFNVVKHAKTQQAQIRAEWKKEELKLSIRDQGSGFNLDHLDQTGRQYGLFNIFQRVDLLGGKCHIESEKKNGTEVIFSFPLRMIQRVEEPAEQKVSISKKVSKEVKEIKENDKIRVLIADDQKMVRRGIMILLQDNPDIEIIGEAENGIQAVEKARNDYPDVILMDVSMPHMDGIEATKILKEEMPDLKIIILSMHEPQEMSKTLLDMGADKYLNKSLGQDEIVQAIRSCWENPAPKKSPK